MNLSDLLPKSGRSSNAPMWIIIGFIAIVIGGVLIASLQPTFFPEVGSAEAQQIDQLFGVMLFIGGMIFLLVEGMLVVSILRFRAKPGDMSDGPPIGGNTTLEFVWTVIPAIIVVILTVYSFAVWTSIRTVKPNEHSIGAVGQRFAWTFTYELNEDNLPRDVDIDNLDPEIQAQLREGMVINYPQLMTWVNQPVHVSLTTQDVNHAFWIPAMRVKQDLLAGRTTDVRFTPIVADVYRIVCAELCGAGHGAMAGHIVERRAADGTETQDLTGAWLVVYPDEETYLREFFEPEARKLIFPPTDPVLLGRALLESGRYPCATCHILDDLGWAGAIGPNLNGIGDRAENRIPGVSADEYLIQTFRDPHVFLVPGYGPLMPQFNDEQSETNFMPQNDLLAIVAYLRSQASGG
jgi:cytochrome c oxidase subunit 2